MVFSPNDAEPGWQQLSHMDDQKTEVMSKVKDSRKTLPFKLHPERGGLPSEVGESGQGRTCRKPPSRSL